MSVRKAALWSVASNYSVFAIQFAVSVIISRFYLAPEELGIFSIAMAAAMLLAVVQDFGINRYLISQKILSENMLRAATALAFFTAFIIALILVALSGTIASYYGDDRLRPLIHIVALSFACGPLGLVPSALLLRDMNFKSVGIINICSAIANAVVAITLAAKGYSAESLAWGTVASALTRGIVGIAFRRPPWPWPIKVADLKPLLAFGSTSTLLSISGAIGVRSTDLIVGRILSLTAVGLYGRAASLTGQLHTLLMGAVGNIFFPAFSSLHREGKDLAPYYERVVALYCGLVAPAMLLLGCISYPLVALLYGDKWLGVAPILLILTIAELPFLALPLHLDIPIALGRIRTLLYLNIVETVISITTLIFFSHWGIEGAAWSRLVYGFCWVAVYAHFMHKLIGFSWMRLAMTYCKSLALAVFTTLPVLIAYLTYASPTTIGLAPLILALICSGCCWLVGLFWIRHPARHDLSELLESIIRTFFPNFTVPERLK